MVRAHFEQVPIEALIGIPFAALAELTTHEQQLLAGEKPLITEERPQIRKLLPIVPRHAADQGTFPVYDLVMRERQEEILVMMVKHREGEIVLMVFAINGVALEITEGVVHPAHVPLEREAQSTEVGWPRDERPGRRFLSDRNDARILSVRDMVEVAEELDCFEVFAPAEFIGNPLSFFAGVVQIEHRSDGVDAQTIDVKTVAPEKGIRRKEIADFMAAIIEDQGAPILMGSFSRVFMLVE